MKSKIVALSKNEEFKNLLKQKRIKLQGLVFCGDNEPETISTIKKFGKKISGREIRILARIPFKSKINKKVFDHMKGLFKKILN